MQLYIGIDDHASTCTYAVLDEQGQLKLEGTVETRLENLRGVLESLRGTRHVAVGNGSEVKNLVFYFIIIAKLYTSEILRYTSQDDRSKANCDTACLWGWGKMVHI